LGYIPCEFRKQILLFSKFYLLCRADKFFTCFQLLSQLFIQFCCLSTASQLWNENKYKQHQKKEKVFYYFYYYLSSRKSAKQYIYKIGANIDCNKAITIYHTTIFAFCWISLLVRFVVLQKQKKKFLSLLCLRNIILLGIIYTNLFSFT